MTLVLLSMVFLGQYDLKVRRALTGGDDCRKINLHVRLQSNVSNDDVYMLPNWTVFPTTLFIFATTHRRSRNGWLLYKTRHRELVKISNDGEEVLARFRR